MIKLRKYFVCVSIMLLAVSCSSEKTQETSDSQAKQIGPKTYSASTEREFETIEKNDYQYRSKYSKSNPRSAQKLKAPVFNSKEITKEVAKEKAPATEIVISKKLNSKNQERLQEINQNLAFFCMKHRKDPVFKDEEKCLEFTRLVLSGCEKKHQIINTVMVNCIKNRLKKRR